MPPHINVMCTKKPLLVWPLTTNTSRGFPCFTNYGWRRGVASQHPIAARTLV